MNDLYISHSNDSIDNFFNYFGWSKQLSINEYPLYAVLWNLFLVIISFFIFWQIKKSYKKSRFKTKQKITFGLLFFLWLLFLPNSAYIVTDIRHLNRYCPGNDLDVCVNKLWTINFFFLYALVGWTSFALLVKKMRELIAKIWGKKKGFIFALSVIPLTAFGVMLGLVNRFNSWDIFISPVLVVKVAFLSLLNINYFFNLLFFIFTLYVMYFVGEYIINYKTRK